MALFRFHRGGLSESLKTTKIVKSKKELSELIMKNDIFKLEVTEKDLCIESYSKKDNFDERIGWYTQMVTVKDPHDGKFYPIGFLSEPLL